MALSSDESDRASSLGSDASRRRNRPPEDDEGSSRAQRNESGPKLYRIRFKTFVKAYCNAHARPSSSVGMTEINADSLQEFLHSLLDVCRRHVVGIAVRDGLDEPASFVLRPAPIEAEDLPGLIRFKASNHVYNVGEDGDLSEKTLTRWTHNATKPDLYIYKYGNNIVNVSEFKRFQTTVLGVPQVDRAGHPSNEAIASVVAQLKDRWGHIYVSDPINWQIWASEISRLSAPQQAARIAEPPPGDIIQLFRHSPADGDAVVASLREDNSQTLAALADLEEQVIEVQERVVEGQDLLRECLHRIEGMHRCIKRYRKSAIALRNALHPDETLSSRNLFEGIPDVLDEDHQ